MITIVKDYISLHRKSMLAKELNSALAKREIGENSKIILGSGLISSARQSNLGQTLTKYKAQKYYVGGRAGMRKTQGYRWAVIIPAE